MVLVLVCLELVTRLKRILDFLLELLRLFRIRQERKPLESELLEDAHRASEIESEQESEDITDVDENLGTRWVRPDK